MSKHYKTIIVKKDKIFILNRDDDLETEKKLMELLKKKYGLDIDGRIEWCG